MRRDLSASVAPAAGAGAGAEGGDSLLPSSKPRSSELEPEPPLVRGGTFCKGSKKVEVELGPNGSFGMGCVHLCAPAGQGATLGGGGHVDGGSEAGGSFSCSL